MFNTTIVIVVISFLRGSKAGGNWKLSAVFSSISEAEIQLLKPSKNCDFPLYIYFVTIGTIRNVPMLQPPQQKFALD